MPRRHHAAVREVHESPGFLAYALLGVAFCAMSLYRVMHQKRKRSRRQLENAREWKAGRTEETLSSKIGRMKERLETLKAKRAAEAMRDERVGLPGAAAPPLPCSPPAKRRR